MVRDVGFSLLELLIVLVIASLFVSISVPYGSRFFEGMQYRSSVRETLSLLNSARHAAVVSGMAQDVIIDVKSGEVSLNNQSVVFPESIDLSGITARELNRDAVGVIRFYPEGDSSGGEVSIRSRSRAVKLSVDWLLGRVSQSRLDAG